MAVAYVQEFPITDDDTTNYDNVVKALDLQAPPAGLIVHSAGFDHEKGVFRIFDVWESRGAGEKWMTDVLNPVLEQVMSEVKNPESFSPPTADYWYELHDSLS